MERLSPARPGSREPSPPRSAASPAASRAALDALASKMLSTPHGLPEAFPRP